MLASVLSVDPGERGLSLVKLYRARAAVTALRQQLNHADIRLCAEERGQLSQSLDQVGHRLSEESLTGQEEAPLGREGHRLDRSSSACCVDHIQSDGGGHHCA